MKMVRTQSERWLRDNLRDHTFVIIRTYRFGIKVGYPKASKEKAMYFSRRNGDAYIIESD